MNRFPCHGPTPPTTGLRRREALAGLAACAVAPQALAALVPAPPALQRANLVVLHQHALADSARFATAIGATTDRVVRFDDLGDLLFHRLAAHWQHPETLLTGVLDPTAYFCLERVALDNGLRTVHFDPSPLEVRHGDGGWPQAAAAQVQRLAAHPDRWQPCSLGWSCQGGEQGIACLMVPRRRLAQGSVT